MASTTRTRQIDAPVERVWATLADFGGLASWAHGLDHSRIVSRADRGVGAVRRVQGGRLTLLETVTAWDEPHRLAYTIDGLPGRFHLVASEWRLEPATGGTGTTVRLTTTVEGGSRPPANVVARAATAALARASAWLLDGLTAHLERVES